MKKIKVFILLLILTTFIPTCYAKNAPKFYAGDDVEVKKEVKGALFGAGNSVETNSNIDGSSFLAGNAIRISSTQDNVFAAGNTISVTGATAKDLFIAGNYITIKESSLRDIYIIGSTIKVNTNIRNAYLGADKVIINGNIEGDLTVAAEKIELGEGVRISGTFSYPKEANIKQEKAVSIGNKKPYKSRVKEKGSKNFVMSKHISRITGQIISLLMMLVIAICFYLINKKFFKKITKLEFSINESMKQFGIGFLLLIAVPVAFIVLLLTIIGVGLGIILLVFYILLIAISVIPISYWLGHNILKDKIKNELGILCLSITIIYIIELIPYISGLTTWILTCMGLGIYFTIIKKSLEEKK